MLVYQKNFLNSIKDKEVLGLLNNISLNYGKIICKATLIDCIEMTSDFINAIKSNHKEYILGIYQKKDLLGYYQTRTIHFQ